MFAPPVSTTRVPVVDSLAFDPETIKRFVQNRQPFVFNDADLSSANYDLDFFRREIPSALVVDVHESASKSLLFRPKRNFSYRRKVMSDFLDELETGDKTLYLRSLSNRPREKPSDITRDYPQVSESFSLNESYWRALFPEVDLPPTGGGFSAQARSLPSYFSSVLRISSPGMSLWTHYDVTDNILIQLHGSKKVLLFEPMDFELLDLVGSSSHLHISLDSEDNVEISRNPERPMCARLATLEPGSILFIPSMFPHSVHCIGDCPSVSVNMFWRGLPSCCYAQGIRQPDLYGNVDLELYQQVFRMEGGARKASEILESLRDRDFVSSLPEDIKLFCLHKALHARRIEPGLTHV